MLGRVAAAAGMDCGTRQVPGGVNNAILSAKLGNNEQQSTAYSFQLVPIPLGAVHKSRWVLREGGDDLYDLTISMLNKAWATLD